MYTYATSGHERLGASRHDYPGQTHAIVHHEQGCPWSFDHQVIEEHRDTYENCSENTAQRLDAWFIHREFFGVTVDKRYTCGGNPLLADEREPGTVFHMSCEAEDQDRVDFTLRYKGSVSFEIGGDTISAAHIIGTGELRGNPSGTSEVELWLHPHTALRLREIRTVDANVQAPGLSGRYHEEAEFRLESLNPER